MAVLDVIFQQFEEVGLGDIPDMGFPEGTIDIYPIMGATIYLAGMIPEIGLAAEDACFFPNENPCDPPVWTLVAGVLPFGVRLNPASGVYVISSSVLLIRGNGPDQFTVAMTDDCGNVITETYYSVPSPTGGAPPGGGGTGPSGCWDLGDLWSITTLCAYQGTYGLQRTANGILGSSDVVSSQVLDTSAGQKYFLSFWAKGSGGADGTITLGFSFYDATNTLISFLGVSTTGSPTSWTQFLGNITAPAGAVTAVPTIRATGHLTGIWCVDMLLAILTGGYFILSGIKSYYDDYSSYR